MNLTKNSRKKVMGLLAIIFGILVIVKPSLLSLLVGVYLIVVGLSNVLE